MFNLKNIGPKLFIGFIYSLFGGVGITLSYVLISFGIILVDWTMQLVGSQLYFALLVIGILLLFYTIGSYLYYKWEDR